MEAKVSRQPVSRQERKWPLGEIVSFNENSVILHHASGGSGDATLDYVFEQELTPKGWRFVADLFGEILLLRKLVKELLRRQGVRIGNSNEYYRDLASSAQKMGVHPDDLKEVVDPILRELFSEMLAKKPSGKVGA